MAYDPYAVASNKTGGNIYSSNFVGPLNYNDSRLSSSGAVLGSKAPLPASGPDARFSSNPSNYVPGGQVGGASAGGGGGGASQFDMLSAVGGDRNPHQEAEFQKLLSAQQNSAEAMRSAELGRANTLYDYNAEQLRNQLSGLDAQKLNAYGEIDLGLSGVKTQADNSRLSAEKNTNTQIQQAGSIAKTSQQQNRNVLRALGIINSSAAGELLSKPINEFGKQRAGLQEALGQRFKELDSFLDQATKEAQSKKDQILTKFTEVYNNIQTDLRFNDRQKIDAINSVNAAASQHLADIQQTVLNYQNQVSLQKQQFAQGLAQMASYNNPSIAKDYLSQMTLSNTGAGKTQQAAIVDPLKKKQV
jgi:hypothetical protein